MSISAPRVMFFGIDAGNRDLLRQWAEDGSLPALQSLQRGGTTLPVENDPGLYVGSVWPSFATGLRADGHGRYCYRQFVPGTYDSPRYPISALQDEPFWNLVSRAGRRVAVVDVPKTPLSANLNGVHVVDWGTHDPDFGFATWPPELATEIREEFGTDPLNGSCDGHRNTPVEFEALRDTLLARVRTRLRISQKLLERGPWDLFIVCFPESHCAGHQFWHLHDTSHDRHSPAMARAIGDPLKAVYAEIDRAIGQLLYTAGQPEVTLVMTSHSMENHYTATPLLEEMLRRLHIGPKQEIRQRKSWVNFLMSLWTRLPGKLRYRLKTLRERIENLLGAIEPSLGGARVQHCFQIPNNDAYGAIRINLIGREPEGRVHPGPEFHAFREALRADLLAFKNDETGEPLAKNVWFTSEHYQGKNRDCLPDLIIEWNKSSPITAIFSPKTGRIARMQAGNRTGDHRNGGFLWAAGPGISGQAGSETVSMVDMAPTICELLDLPFSGRDGKPIVTLRRNSGRSSSANLQRSVP